MKPNFRYLADIDKYLAFIEQEIDELTGLASLQKKLLAKTIKVLGAETTFVVNDQTNKSMRRLAPKNNIDITPVKVKIPGGIKALSQQYSLIEELYDKVQELDSIEMSLKTMFKDDRGSEGTLSKIKFLREKVAKQVKAILKELSSIASDHVPEKFKEYVEVISNEIEEHVSFKKSRVDYFAYTVDGSIAFASYIWLFGATNDEGTVVSQMYICINWVVGTKKVDADMKVSLGYDWEPPAKLYKGPGVQVTSTSSAATAVGKLLDLEQFSTVLGTVPIEQYLRKPNAKINIDTLVAKDYVKTIVVDNNTLTVNLKKITNQQILQQVHRDVYMDIRKLFKKPAQVKLSVSGNGLCLTFYITNIAQQNQLSALDYNYFKDHWNLSAEQINKISRIIEGIK